MGRCLHPSGGVAPPHRLQGRDIGHTVVMAMMGDPQRESEVHSEQGQSHGVGLGALGGGGRPGDGEPRWQAGWDGHGGRGQLGTGRPPTRRTGARARKRPRKDGASESSLLRRRLGASLGGSGRGVTGEREPRVRKALPGEAQATAARPPPTGREGFRGVRV